MVTGAATQKHAALFGSARLALIEVRFAYILEETWSIVLVGCLRTPNDSRGVHWAEPGFTKNVIDESSLADPYRQGSSHRSLDDIDGSNGSGIHQIEIFILMAGKTCRTCPACFLMAMTFRFPRADSPAAGQQGFEVTRPQKPVLSTSIASTRELIAKPWLFSHGPYADVFIDQKVCRSMTMTVSNAGK
jgi:hypothetical protein